MNNTEGRFERSCSTRATCTGKSLNNRCRLRSGNTLREDYVVRIPGTTLRFKKKTDGKINNTKGSSIETV